MKANGKRNAGLNKGAGMKLYLMAIVSTEKGRLDYDDQRRKPNRSIASYRGEDGHEYRKAFFSYGEPFVPAITDHKEAAELERQYQDNG